MDAPLSPSGLFGYAVNSVVERFQESAKQAAVFQKLLPRRIHISGAAEREQAQTSKSSSLYRAAQKQSTAYRAPPHKDWGHGKHTQPQSSKCKMDLRMVINSKKAAGKRSWHPRAQAIEEIPPRSRAVNTSFYGARLPLMSSGDRSANPATLCASGRSGLRRAHVSRSTRKRSGLGVTAPSEEDFRAVSSDASCRFTVSGRCSVRTNTYKSRNQSREAGTPSIIFGSMGTSAKYISLGSADYRKRVSNTVRVSPSKVHGGVVHRGAPPAASGYGTRSESSFRERGHRICTSLQHGNRVLQPVLHSSKEGWGVVSHFRSSSSERLHQAAQVQILTLRQIMPQIRSEDWFVKIDLKDAYFHISILPCHRRFLRFAFGGKAYQYRVLPFGLALSPRTFTKCVDATLVPLRLQGIHIMNYSEQCALSLYIAPAQRRVKSNTPTSLHRLLKDVAHMWGFSVNPLAMFTLVRFSFQMKTILVCTGVWLKISVILHNPKVHVTWL